VNDQQPPTVVADEFVRLGVSPPEAVVGFSTGTEPDGAWGGQRLLLLRERPAFELSHWCGTCPFLFERREGADGTLSDQRMSGRLRDGLTELDDDVLQAYGSLLPDGDYVPLLLTIVPELVAPSEPRDYFSHEQVATWGVDTFWGLPAHPRTVYYRTYETPVSDEQHLYEFVVPMVPPTWNDRATVDQFIELLRGECLTPPTAVAVSTLDVCQPASGHGTDHYEHWALTHFLLDGHHKLEAAARLGVPLTLLTLLSVGGSLVNDADLARIAAIRSRPAARR
jgi:hypothetical protein